MVKNDKKHPIAVFDGKYHYLRQDFIVEACEDIANVMAKDFKIQYERRNIEEKAANGEDVNVRLEKSICKMNVKNIKGAGKYMSDYFANCVKPIDKSELKK